MSVDQIITHLIMEFIGSMILAIGLVILHVDFVINVAVYPFFMIAAVASCYRVTGGHLNPAVTIANLLRFDKPENFDYILAIFYVFAQYFGCIAGCFLAWWFSRTTGSLVLLKNPNDLSESQYSEAIGFEVFGAFVLVLAYLSQSGKDTWISPDSGIQAIFVGTSYSALVLFSSLVAGGSLNPAYAFGQNLVKWVDNEDEYSIQFLWLYTVMPFVGAFFAYFVHQFIMVPGSKESPKIIEVDMVNKVGNAV
jgi:glycerol uptake facilitator-like aquaporin